MTIFQILGFLLFPRECVDKDMAAMLDDITKEANEKASVYFLQHGVNATEEFSERN
jgi:hypothetical protein